MTKAKFDREQPELTMYEEGKSIRYMIAENGRQYTEEDAEGNTSKGYEYDFNEFSELKETLSPDTVKASPADYLTYVPVGKAPEQTTSTGSTLAQRVADIEDTLAAIVGGEA